MKFTTLTLGSICGVGLAIGMASSGVLWFMSLVFGVMVVTTVSYALDAIDKW